jgi:hypothetical protein
LLRQLGPQTGNLQGKLFNLAANLIVTTLTFVAPIQDQRNDCNYNGRD